MDAHLRLPVCIVRVAGILLLWKAVRGKLVEHIYTAVHSQHVDARLGVVQRVFGRLTVLVKVLGFRD